MIDWGKKKVVVSEGKEYEAEMMNAMGVKTEQGEIQFYVLKWGPSPNKHISMFRDDGVHWMDILNPGLSYLKVKCVVKNKKEDITPKIKRLGEEYREQYLLLHVNNICDNRDYYLGAMGAIDKVLTLIEENE